MANYYTKGAVVRCSATFETAAGVATDPAAVTGKFKDPSGNETSYVYGTASELVKDATGNYHFDISTDETGKWWYRYESAGMGQAAKEGFFMVLDSQFD